jgi:hypothetical protein
MVPMGSIEATENPYASPTYDEPQVGTDALRRGTVRIYHRMGWAGVAYALLVLIVTLCNFAEHPSEMGIAGGLLLEAALILAFFVFMINTARRLSIDVARNYRRARWLGILAASIFFPIFTIPGILAVRRLERYRTHVVASGGKLP